METSKEIAIQVNDVSKVFHVFKSNHGRTIYELFGREHGSDVLTALDHISLTLYRGEKLAILGNIGAGRTTLLKILAGVAFPTEGTVSIHGKMQSILDLKVGFDRMLSGRENIRIRGGMMGWPKETIRKREQELIDFAEVEDIIDHPVRTYKGGEAARLGLAMYTADKPDILIMDQGFGVGEPIHKDKCIDRIEEIIQGDETTFIFATNTAKYIKRLCTRAIILEEGRICFDGDVTEALDLFKKEYKRTTKKEEEKKNEELEEARETGSDDFSAI